MTIDSNEREMRQSNLDQPKKQPDKRNQRPVEEENNIFSRIFCKRMELKFGVLYNQDPDRTLDPEKTRTPDLYENTDPPRKFSKTRTPRKFSRKHGPLSKIRENTDPPQKFEKTRLVSLPVQCG